MYRLNNLFKLKPFIKKHKLYFAIGIIEVILSSLASIPGPYIIGYLMDEILLLKKNYNEFYEYIAIIAVFYIITYILSISSKNMFIKINNFVVSELRYCVMKKVLGLPMSYLANTEKGYVQSRISECNTIGNIFSPSIISEFLAIINAFLSIITMFSINSKLTFIVILLVPIFFFSSKISSKNFSKYTKKMMESNAILNGDCFEIISGIEDIKVLNGKEIHLKKFRNRIDELTKISIKQSKSMVLLIENIGIVNKFGSLLILLFSGFLILNEQFTIGLYTSFSLYINKVFMCAEGLASLETTIKPVCVSIERLYELLDMNEESQDGYKLLEEPIESLEFKNVSFQYNKDRIVLNSLSFNINKCDKVLIRGENGAGKSTIIKLLLGLYKQTQGEILYNNINLNKINIESLRERVGIVCQNIFLFKGTVLENILYGQKNKSKQDVEEIIKQLNLQEYVNRMPKGLDTEIIQNTTGVSGGQSQIIAFIRAIISKKDILILDEPISNVDTETRDIVLNIIRDTNFNGILIIVSHITEGMEFINKTIDI